MEPRDVAQHTSSGSPTDLVPSISHSPVEERLPPWKSVMREQTEVVLLLTGCLLGPVGVGRQWVVEVMERSPLWRTLTHFAVLVWNLGPVAC
jgi:hypothetical protein